MHKVLVVESSKQTRTEIVESLGELTNVSILGAVADSVVALRALEHAAPTVVVIDPGLHDANDGVALIAEARRRSSTLAVIVFDMDVSGARRQRCLDAGADAYVNQADGLVALQRAVIGARVARSQNTAAPGRLAVDSGDRMHASTRRQK